MAKGGRTWHLAVRGLWQMVSVPACGAWSRDLARDLADVSCPDCRATLDYAMASEENGDG
jgi:hypothetical protein